MTKAITLEPKLQRMLELLADGASTRVLSRKTGYSEGTVRVYLHNLYRKIGVKNRTEAVLWRLRHAAVPPKAELTAQALADESFGTAALREGLLATLGIMESFLGPYGRLWEVGLRLKGQAMDEELATRRGTARSLWRALLDADFAWGKRFHEDGRGERLALGAPSEAVLLAVLLMLGGFTSAADAVVKQLARGRRPAAAASPRELELLRSLRAALYANDDEALASIHRAASSSAASAPQRHVAMAVLFHAYRARHDTERAAVTADALWNEADGARRQLEAMGVRTLGREASPPAPARVRPASTVREREKVAR